MSEENEPSNVQVDYKFPISAKDKDDTRVITVSLRQHTNIWKSYEDNSISHMVVRHEISSFKGPLFEDVFIKPQDKYDIIIALCAVFQGENDDEKMAIGKLKITNAVNLLSFYSGVGLEIIETDYVLLDLKYGPNVQVTLPAITIPLKPKQIQIKGNNRESNTHTLVEYSAKPPGYYPIKISCIDTMGALPKRQVNTTYIREGAFPTFQTQIKDSIEIVNNEEICKALQNYRKSLISTTFNKAIYHCWLGFEKLSKYATLEEPKIDSMMKNLQINVDNKQILTRLRKLRGITEHDDVDVLRKEDIRILNKSLDLLQNSIKFMLTQQPKRI